MLNRNLKKWTASNLYSAPDQTGVTLNSNNIGKAPGYANNSNRAKPTKWQLPFETLFALHQSIGANSGGAVSGGDEGKSSRRIRSPKTPKLIHPSPALGSSQADQNSCEREREVASRAFERPHATKTSSFDASASISTTASSLLSLPSAAASQSAKRGIVPESESEPEPEPDGTRAKPLGSTKNRGQIRRRNFDEVSQKWLIQRRVELSWFLEAYYAHPVAARKAQLSVARPPTSFEPAQHPYWGGLFQNNITNKSATSSSSSNSSNPPFLPATDTTTTATRATARAIVGNSSNTGGGGGEAVLSCHNLATKPSAIIIDKPIVLSRQHLLELMAEGAVEGIERLRTLHPVSRRTEYRRKKQVSLQVARVQDNLQQVYLYLAAGEVHLTTLMQELDWSKTTTLFYKNAILDYAILQLLFESR